MLFDEFESDKIHSFYRWNELLHQLEALNADIIGLQEVTEQFLKKVLETPWVREHYHISDIDGAHTTPYGQIVLAKYPFKLSYYEYSSHKRVVIATFSFNGRPTHVPVVHLTSDHGKGNLGAKRLAQMNIIYDRTVPSRVDADKDNGADCIVIGDFNMGDGGEGEGSSLRTDFVDCWKSLNGLSDPGYTFDPQENRLAAITTKSGDRRRYDRVLVRSAAFHWQPLLCTKINTEPLDITIADGTVVKLPPSDHFGVLAQLQYIDNANERAALLAAQRKIAQQDREMALNIASFLQSEQMLETPTQLSARQAALQRLNELVAQVCNGPEGFRLFPVGSFGLGVHTPHSDMDILCCSSTPAGDFFAGMTRYLNSQSKKDSSIGTCRLILDAVVPIISVTILNVPIDLQYATIRNVTWGKTNVDLVKVLEEADERPLLDQASFLAAQSYRALRVLTSLIPDLNVFKHAYLIIKRWAAAKGLDSNKMGFLGGHAWTIMLTRVAQANSRASVMGLVAEFFSTYASWDFRNNPVTVNMFPAINYNFVSKKEPICVITCTTPHKNITRNATHSSRRILIAELQKAHSIVSRPGNPQEVLRDLWTPLAFTSLHSSYLQINFSAATHREYSQWAGQIESRLVQLLLWLESSPAVLARPWPTRYVYASSSFKYGGSFLIGLSAIKENVREKEAEKSGGHLDLSRFVDDFKAAMERWAGFDAESMRLNIRQRSRASLESDGPLPETLSTYSLEDILAEDQDAASSSDEEVEETAEPEPVASPSAAPAPAAASSSSTNGKIVHKPAADSTDTKYSSSKAKAKKQGNQDEEPAPKRRMRTSEECMSWIRHDHRFNPEEFIVAYEDRFAGLQEVPLNDWTHDQSSLVFIPMHRVWLIRHNGRIVWDRKNRIDTLDDLVNPPS